MKRMGLRELVTARCFCAPSQSFCLLSPPSPVSVLPRFFPLSFPNLSSPSIHSYLHSESGSREAEWRQNRSGGRMEARFWIHGGNTRGENRRKTGGRPRFLCLSQTIKEIIVSPSSFRYFHVGDGVCFLRWDSSTSLFKRDSNLLRNANELCCKSGP